MEQIVNQFSERVWTVVLFIVSTIIGAIISYVATTAAERRKEKRADQKERLKDVLIPLGTAIEDAVEACKQYDDIQMDAFHVKISAPADYLQPAKRVYLTKEERDELTEYKKLLDEFYEVWSNERKEVYLKFKQWLGQEMLECPDAPVAMYANVSVNFNADNLDRSVLNKELENFGIDIHTINYVLREDIEENYRAISFSFTDEIKATAEAIERGYAEKSLLDGFDIEDKTAANLYISYLGINVREELQSLINETKTNTLFNQLKNKAEEIDELLIDNMDKIAG